MICRNHFIFFIYTCLFSLSCTIVSALEPDSIDDNSFNDIINGQFYDIGLDKPVSLDTDIIMIQFNEIMNDDILLLIETNYGISRAVYSLNNDDVVNDVDETINYSVCITFKVNRADNINSVELLSDIVGACGDYIVWTSPIFNYDNRVSVIISNSLTILFREGIDTKDAELLLSTYSIDIIDVFDYKNQLTYSVNTEYKTFNDQLMFAEILQQNNEIIACEPAYFYRSLFNVIFKNIKIRTNPILA